MQTGVSGLRPVAVNAGWAALRTVRLGRWLTDQDVVDNGSASIVGANSPALEALPVMDILLDKRAVRQIRVSAGDAIEDGDTETLREDVMDAFSEEQIEEIERRIDGGDFYDFIGDTLEEWDGDDIDELFELLESHLSDVGIELKLDKPEAEEEEEEEEEDEEEFTAGGDEDDIGDPLELDEEPESEEET